MANAASCEITGNWAEQAKQMIDIDYLLTIFPGQLQGWPRQFVVRKWGALALKLGLDHPTLCERDMLVAMQKYIATTPPEQRCPCTRGVVLNTIQEHFPECDAVPALEWKSEQLAKLDAERMQIELRRQRIEQTWRDNQRSADLLQATWNPMILTHCPRVFLNDVKRDVEDEIKKRLNEFQYLDYF